jgi:hypothetical protein
VENTLMISSFLPLFVFILNLFLLEDSPRNFLIRNKEKEAFEILEAIYQKKIEEKSKTLIKSIEASKLKVPNSVF